MLSDATTARAADGRLFINRTLRTATLPFSLLLLFFATATLPSNTAAQSFGGSECFACKGQLNALRAVYTGVGTVDITILPGNGNGGTSQPVTFTGVTNGDEVSIGPGTPVNSYRLGSTTTFRITDAGGNVTNVPFHTSCSQPIGPGVSRGDITITYASSRNGGPGDTPAEVCPTLDKTSTSHPDLATGSDAAGELTFAPAQAAEIVTYRITLFNTSDNSTLSISQVTDQLSDIPDSPTTPSYVTGSAMYSSGSPTVSFNNQQITFGNIPTIGIGNTFIITYDVEIPNFVGNGGEWPNTATACFTNGNGAACAQDNYLVFGGGNLPVELVAFNAVLDGSAVNLTWQTASETNNAGFYVEMAESNLAKDRVFERLDFIDGHGTTLESQNYTYGVDALAPGRYTFRLLQVDYDGTNEYSPEVEVVVGLTEGFLLESAYPNPFRGRSQFRFAVQREQAVRAELYDLLGHRVKVLFEGTAREGGMQPVTIDGSDLSSGVYLLRVVGERFSETQRVTLIK